MCAVLCRGRGRVVLQLPPKGVDWEVSYCAEGDKKWANVVAPKEYDNVYIGKLLPGGTASDCCC